MEGQITLNEWMEWKEDIRRKLQETAGNFVYIGYRLKQIRDSGMYDGSENIFEFAEKEYGLSKSVVSRFMAINDKFSKHGNSIELRDEFVGLNQSQLSEMLTLPVSDYEMVTEETSIKEIRELKAFEKDAMNPPEEDPGTEAPENGSTMQVAENPDSGNEPDNGTPAAAEAVATSQQKEWTPLQKCIIDFFRDKLDLLRQVNENIDEEKTVAELIAPSGSVTHRKGLVVLTMKSYDKGVMYKQMGVPLPISMTWEKFIAEIDNIFIEGQTWNIENKIKEIYPETVQKEPEIVQKPQKTEIKPQKTEEIVKEPQRSEPVATSQQEEKGKEDTVEEEPKEEASPAAEDDDVKIYEPGQKEVKDLTDYEIRDIYDDIITLSNKLRVNLEMYEWKEAHEAAADIREKMDIIWLEIGTKETEEALKRILEVEDE